MRGVRRLDLSLVLGLFAASVMLRVLLLLPHLFDGLYGQDAYSYYDFARQIQRSLTQGTALEPFFWPLGYPVLLAAAFSLFGAQPTTAQTLNVLLGASLSPAVYVLARQVSSGWAGALAAGIVMAVCGQALQSSLVVMADIPALAWAALSAIALCVHIRGGSWRWLMAAAILLAIASVTRWLYLSLAIPWGAALLFAKPVRWRYVLPAMMPAATILLAQVAYNAASPYPALNHAWVQGWSIENAWRREFINVDGRFFYEMENWRFYAKPFYDAYYLSPILAPFLLPGVLALVPGEKRAPLAIMIGWALLPYLFLVGIPYQNIRFPLIVFPAAAILVGMGLETVMQWSNRWPRLSQGRWVVAGLVVALGSGQALIAAQSTIGPFIANQQRDKDSARWAADQIPVDSTVYTFGLTLTLRHYTNLNAAEIYYETPETLAERWRRGQDDYLLVNVWNIENQWAGREPQIAFHWLRDARGLVELGRHGNYTLYRVEG
jgi:4-amino-4-deoxy-L-arabinose transferase-like glycosyltransferase